MVWGFNPFALPTATELLVGTSISYYANGDDSVGTYRRPEIRAQTT